MKRPHKHTNLQPGQKVPPSSRLFIALESCGALLAVVFIAVSLCCYIADEHMGLKLFGMLFWPLAVSVALAFMLGVGQLLRGRDGLAIAGIAVAGCCTAVTIAIIAAECVHYGTFFIFPFTIAG